MFEVSNTYDPISTIERIAAAIAEVYPEKSVALLVAATELESRLHRERGDERDRLALAQHWAEHD